MTNTLTAYAAPIARRIAAGAALLGGAALVIDTVTITVLNSSFGVLDDVLFFTGFVGMLVFAAAFAAQLSSRSQGMAQLVLGVLVFVATIAILGACSWLFDTLGRHVFSTANVGLHGEWSFFSIGVALLVISGLERARARRGVAG